MFELLLPLIEDNFLLILIVFVVGTIIVKIVKTVIKWVVIAVLIFGLIVYIF